MMTNRERILAALRREETDRLPWAPLVDGYYTSSLHLQGRSEDYLTAVKEIGCDIMERHVHAADTAYRNVEIAFQRSDGLIRETIETPVGRLCQECTMAGNTSIVTRYFVSSPEEIKVFTYLADHTDYTPSPKTFAQRDAEIGDAGIATLSGPASPIQELLQTLCGVENTVYFLLDYEDEMRELLDAMHRRNLRHYKALLEAPAAVLFDYEDTSTTVMNRTMLTDLSAPCMEEYARLTRESGKRFIAHMCGKLSGFKDIIAGIDVDGIDSVCPPTTGDLHLWDAREAWGPQKLLIGGIEPPSLCFQTPKETVSAVAQIMLRLTEKRGVILSTGDAVPYGTPMENLIAVSKFVEALGGAAMLTRIDGETLANAVAKAISPT